MAETVNSYVSKYSGDQLDAAIAALGSLQEWFASKADFEDFVKKFTAKMDEFITAANNSASKAETATAKVEDATKTLASTNETLKTMISGLDYYYVKIDDNGNEIK